MERNEEEEKKMTLLDVLEYGRGAGEAGANL